MSDKIHYSTKDTQLYYEDSNQKILLDYVSPHPTPGFWFCQRNKDKRMVSISYDRVKILDPRFDK